MDRRVRQDVLHQLLASTRVHPLLVSCACVGGIRQLGSNWDVCGTHQRVLGQLSLDLRRMPSNPDIVQSAYLLMN